MGCNHKQMMQEFIIVGGGIAGLAAANRLLDHGVNPLILEGEKEPKEKVSGDFFSPEALPLLSKWGIEEGVEIKNIHFHLLKTVPFQLREVGRSCSLLRTEELLSQRAEKLGAKILRGCPVLSLEPGMKLVTHQGTFFAKKVLIASGRVNPIEQKVSFKYTGFKGYLQEAPLPHTLELFPLRGGYWGKAPVGNGMAIIAGLVRGVSRDPREILGQIKTPWITCNIPEFGFKKIPHWENTFFLGDAFATIPPVSGKGLTLSLLSGILAADFALFGNEKEYHKTWRKMCSSPIFFAKATSSLLLYPTIANFVAKFPFATEYLFDQWRKSTHAF
jgi:flavin-dependent dehydrogenase